MNAILAGSLEGFSMRAGAGGDRWRAHCFLTASITLEVPSRQ
jgi:hypothetical protein